ncbi:hypothetical protein LguiB_012175 [Lonicera macranthoides]
MASSSSNLSGETFSSSSDVASSSNPHFCRKFFKKVEFSWIDEGVLGEVRHQGKCTVCAIESEYNKRHPNDKIRLAVQEVVDCYKHKYPGKSNLEEDKKVRCFTNKLTEGFKYVKEFGICEEKHYPFKAARGNDCKACQINCRRFTIDCFEELLATDEQTILAVIREQPIAGGIRIPNDAKSLLGHKRGVYRGPDPRQDTADTAGRHAFLIIGYGEEKGAKYYFVQNSWGKGWGIQGYGKIARDLVVRFIRPINTHLIE